ncbi:unnamed protein product [Sympodiomycopsis kandeliae]
MASPEYLKAATHILPTLKAFPSDFQAFFGSHPVLSLHSWLTYYATADPLHTAIVLCAISSAAVYVTQQFTGNASQVDRIWTFAPVWYGAHFTLQPVIAAKLISNGFARETLQGILKEPSRVGVFAQKYFGSGDVKAHLEPRLALMLGLQLLWSARLTFNAWRRGFFKAGEEDYRWPELRKSMSRWQWELFAFFFIAIAQNILLAATALPQYLILTTTLSTQSKLSHSSTLSLTKADLILEGAFIVNLIFEFLADHQQQAYQNWKRGQIADFFGRPQSRSALKVNQETPKTIGGTSSGKASPTPSILFDWRTDEDLFTEDDRKRGFLTRGLWSLSRHPNFACEQMVWWLLYLFVPITFAQSLFRNVNVSNASAKDLLKYGHPLVANYAILSPVLMTLLFISSTDFTERLSMKKYPAYKQYRKAVGPFSPLDTLLRKVYYTVFAGKKEQEQVYADVWGKVSGDSKKSN